MRQFPVDISYMVRDVNNTAKIVSEFFLVRANKRKDALMKTMQYLNDFTDDSKGYFQFHANIHSFNTRDDRTRIELS